MQSMWVQIKTHGGAPRYNRGAPPIAPLNKICRCQQLAGTHSRRNPLRLIFLPVPNGIVGVVQVSYVPSANDLQPVREFL